MKSNKLMIAEILPIVVGLLIISVTLAANRSPVASNVRAEQRPGTHLIDISYDLEDADYDQLAISIEVSNDGGKSFTIIPKSLSGDVGSNVRIGKGKKIVWDAGVDMPNVKGSNFQIKVIADDGKGQSNTIIGKDGAEMVLIPAGEFLMGSPDGEGAIDERPQHTVYLDAFYIDKYEVTNAQYKKFMDATGHRVPYVNENWAKPYNWQNGTYPSGKGNHPVVLVSWNDAEAYCKWAGKRLPTEAEWEKAARGGLEGKKYPWGDEDPKGRANYASSGIQAVGSYAANGYGLYDMAGNVWEWCVDWYDKNYYQTSSKYNPKGPNSGEYKVLRGGSWASYGTIIRAAYRYYIGAPVSAAYFIGFRCVSSVP